MLYIFFILLKYCFLVNLCYLLKFLQYLFYYNIKSSNQLHMKRCNIFLLTICSSNQFVYFFKYITFLKSHDFIDILDTSMDMSNLYFPTIVSYIDQYRPQCDEVSIRLVDEYTISFLLQLFLFHFSK